MKPFSTISRLLLAPVAMAVLASSALAQNTYRIGSVLSVTGPAAFLGEDMKAGFELAIEEINAGGGIDNRKIEWFFYDAESQVQKGLSATRRLLSQDKVDMIVGGGNMSGMALAMLQQTERAKIPFISTEGSVDIVTPVDKRQWTFKSSVDDRLGMERFADYLHKKGIKRAALLADSSGFGQSAVEQLKIVAAARGLDVVYETFNPSDTDLTPQLSRLKSAGVKAILCWTVTPAGVVFLKQAKAMDMKNVQLFHGLGFVDQRYMALAGDAARDVLLISVKFPVGEDLPDSDPMKSKIQALNKAFESKFGRLPNQFAAQTYDAIYIAKAALERAGGADKGRIRDAIEGITAFQGVGGVFNFSATQHSPLSGSDLVLVKYEDGRFRLADYR